MTVLGDRIDYTYLGGNFWTHAQLFGYKLLAMSTRVAQQRGYKFWALLPHILVSQIGVHVHH